MVDKTVYPSRRAGLSLKRNVKPPSRIPKGYGLVWGEEFDVFSPRLGGPTEAGLAAGKGIWSLADAWYRNGDPLGLKNEADAYFPDPLTGTWPADYPPLGQYDLSPSVLRLVSDNASPAMALLMPSCGEAVAKGTDLLPAAPWGNPWYNQMASLAIGEPVDGLPPMAIIGSGGDDWHGREVQIGEVVRQVPITVTLFFEYLSSGKAGILFGVSGTGTIVDCAGLSVTGISGDAAVTKAKVRRVGNHHELSLTWTPLRTGSAIIRIMPRSIVAGETVGAYRLAMISSGNARRPRYPGAQATSRHSFYIAPPFYRVARVRMPKSDQSWPSSWSLGKNKKPYPSDDQYAKEFEIDDMENFGRRHEISNAVHWNVADGPGAAYLGVGRIYPSDRDFWANWHTFGALVTETETTFYCDDIETFVWPHPDGSDPTQAMYHILGHGSGVPFETPYAGPLPGPQVYEVDYVRYYAPASNTSAVIPPAPPVAAVAWRAGFAGGAIPESTPANTVVADLSGCTSYGVKVTGDTFAVAGTTLKTAAAMNFAARSSHHLHVYGVAADGMQAFIPTIPAVVLPGI